MKYVLGQAREEEFKEYFNTAKENHDLTSEWLLAFYRAVKGFDGTNQGEFKMAMRELIDMTGPGWQDTNEFLSRVWCEEFFLARHEGGF